MLAFRIINGIGTNRFRSTSARTSATWPPFVGVAAPSCPWSAPDVFEEGCLQIPDRPGLGLTLKPDALEGMAA